jgi:uncharacterized RDD family membrane protein YckC
VQPFSPPSGPPAAPATIRLASIGARALAWIIDEIIVFIPAVLVVVVVMASRIDLGSTPPPDLEEVTDAMPAWLAFVPIAFRIVYDAVLVAWLGRTVGMMVLRIRVQSVVGGGLPWWQAGIRAMVPGLAQCIPVYGSFARMGVYLSASFDESRRGLHDRAAGSLVIAVPRPAPIAVPPGYPGWYPGTVPPPPPPASRPDSNEG